MFRISYRKTDTKIRILIRVLCRKEALFWNTTRVGGRGEGGGGRGEGGINPTIRANPPYGKKMATGTFTHNS